MPSLIDSALAATNSSNAPARASRSALAVGTVGRLGEELINCLLENPDYQAVHVVVETAMRSMLPRLLLHQVSPAAIKALPRAGDHITLPRAEDVFCCISDARSYFKRDRAYVMLSKEQVAPLARIAAGNGARRFVLIAPLSAFMQLTAPSGGLIDVLESDLVAVGFQALIIVRPATDYATAQGSVVERLIGWGAKAIMQIMIPQRLQPLRARQIAQAAVNAARLLNSGVHVVGAQEIAQLAAPGTPVVVKRRRL